MQCSVGDKRFCSQRETMNVGASAVVSWWILPSAPRIAAGGVSLPLEGIGRFLAGFNSVTPVEKRERDILLYLIRARIPLSIAES